MAPTLVKDLFLLLTDDDEDDREIFKETAEELETKVKVDTLNDGQELMEFLSDKDNRLPDILFLDINMPHKNGLDSLCEIRATPRLNDLCIIMYSTSNYPLDVKKAYDLGANGFIEKPSSHIKLKEILQRVIDMDWKDPCSKLDELNFVLRP
ncbi:response regulator [Pricia sp. S334]|uniref:Response regulator n=1 Tax=Pricia mediterranea TaxID=3076079 RepID=A0ABU3L368_9FLAO|nr:response regulator [Pricia sp. S334]MDT7827746.1 response regulator [Pricia sp. S334]